jgi:hypothetical protein
MFPIRKNKQFKNDVTITLDLGNESMMVNSLLLLLLLSAHNLLFHEAKKGLMDGAGVVRASQNLLKMTKGLLGPFPGFWFSLGLVFGEPLNLKTLGIIILIVKCLWALFIMEPPATRTHIFREVIAHPLIDVEVLPSIAFHKFERHPKR